MRHSRVPWKEKLRPELEARVVVLPGGRGTLLIPTPMLVAKAIRGVRKGKLVTPAAIRGRLAAELRADATCPLTTGIFFNIVAGAAEEDRAAGRKPLAPWWRVVDDAGRLSEKTPPGPERQAELLRGEGHRVVRSGARFRVDAETARSGRT